jgi:hypothetical protein
MFNTLQPSSLIPYTNGTPKIEAVNKPAVVIPITTDIKIISPANKAILQKLPFEKWNLPVQEEGYIKGRRCDFL